MFNRVVVDAAGSPTSPDGPGPSILGSLDNIFGSVKNFDQYRCIERMLCEYMQEDGDAVSELIQRPFAGFQAPSTPPTRSPNRFAPQGSQFGSHGQFGSQGQFGAQSQFGAQGQFGQQSQNQQQEFNSISNTGEPQLNPNLVNNQRPNPFAPPPQSQGPQSPSLISELSGILFGRRKKRQTITNTQGNIIRLFQATGMDSLNLFPYVRAALIGHATRSDKKAPFTRRVSSCQQMYRECPTEPDRILDYLNNHNGGLVNQVQPSVNQEVGPLLSAIVADTIGGDTSSSSSSSSGGSSGFGTIDQLVSSAIINNAAGMFTGESSSTATSPASGSGLSGLLGNFGGLSNLLPGTGGNTAASSDSGLLNSALSTFSSFVSGKRK